MQSKAHAREALKINLLHLQCVLPNYSTESLITRNMVTITELTFERDVILMP